ncbi:MAG TPA: hypothetical protein VGK62_01800 [Gaiellaceae bacterium]
MDISPVLDSDDPRIGVTFLTAAQLAEINGKTAAGIRDQLERIGVVPAAFLRGSWAYLFAAEDIQEHGLLPERSFDPESEAWGRELADQIGVASTTQFMYIIATRYGRRAGLGQPASVAALAEAGVIRRFGRRWAFDRARVADLLTAPYDPELEATAAELLAQYGCFSNTANLARAMRGHVESRRVLDLDGRDRVVWDRAGAAEFFAGRNRSPRTRRSARLSPADEPVWRDHIGPFILGAPTQRVTVHRTQAQFVLDASRSKVEALVSSNPDASVPNEPGIAIAWLEATLLARHDLEGLLLLARLIDGLLVLDPSLDRTRAVLAVIEKAG